MNTDIGKDSEQRGWEALGSINYQNILSMVKTTSMEKRFFGKGLVVYI